MKKYCYLIIIMFITKLAYACDCKEFSAAEEFNFSRNVFIGKIITVSNDIFSAEVLENFKGSVNHTVSFNINDCSISPKVGENWLIYTSGYYVSFCGWSRNLNNPEQSAQYMEPVLFTDDVAKKEIVKLKKDKATLELKLDLINLRKNKGNVPVKQKSSIHKLDCDLIIGLFTTFILIIIYLFVKNRQLRKRIHDYTMP